MKATRIIPLYLLPMLKKIALVAACLVGLVIVLAGAGLAYLILRKPAQAPPSSIKVAMTPERIAASMFSKASPTAAGATRSAILPESPARRSCQGEGKATSFLTL